MEIDETIRKHKNTKTNKNNDRMVEVYEETGNS